MEGYQSLRGATLNQDVQRQAEAQIKDAQRNISYLEESLMTLQGRRTSSGAMLRNQGAPASSATATPNNTGFYRPSPTSSERGPMDYGPEGRSRQGSNGPPSMTSSGSMHSPYSASNRPYPGDSSSSYLTSSTSDVHSQGSTGPGGNGGMVDPRRYDDRNMAMQQGGGQQYQRPMQGGQRPPGGPGYGGGPPMMRPGDPYNGQMVNRMGTSAKKNYTNLDLIKYDTPHTTAKISRMLHQIEFKLQIEKQYKMGIDKMAKLYQADGDRKSRTDAESKRVESASKIRLLQQSLKRYKQLHVMEDSGEEEMPGSLEDKRQSLRKPLSGTLQVSVRSARDIDHAPNPRIGRNTRESTVVIKVEDVPRARTHPSRTDRWQEDFEVAVDNANEIEVTVYDRMGNNHPEPVGMLWIRISDIVEELRKKKFGQVSGQDGTSAAPGGWVTADDVQQQGPITPGGGAAMMDSTFNDSPAGVPVPMGPTSDGVEAWFAVEPAGSIYLRLNFVKQNVRKRPYDARLGRQGAFRKRKEDVAEINGHKFISRQFYQIIRCALCGELLLNAAGSQCEDCRYTCHKKCALKVVTKCISKSNAEADRDEVKINHRIPHRFMPITNIGANWCCHCGLILPLGRKNARKCSECDLTCHGDCAHLVPDLCGMSMEMANQLLSDMEAINRVKSSAKTQAALTQGGPQVDKINVGRMPSSNDVRLTGLEQQTAQMGLRPMPPQQQQIQQQQQQQQGMPPSSSMGNMYGGRPMPPSQQQLQQPPPRFYGQGGPPMDMQARPPRPLPRPESGSSDGSRPGAMAPSTSQQSMQQSQLPASQSWRPSVPASASQTSLQLSPQKQAMMPPTAPTSMPPMQMQEAPPMMQQQPLQMPPAPMALQQQTVRDIPSSKRKIGLNDFNFLAVLGKGNFGKVMLAEEKKSGYLYAIKVLKKEFIIENDEVESTKSEKRVFLAAARARHPFLLGLHSCFQTETRVYFVMEYVSGGDLMLHIQREQFTPRRAKFYAAEVLLALEYFHKEGIIYRDLKLDNIMLTLDGHVKVADYGLCKEDMWYGKTTSTFCGTPEFMAPEILLEQRYGRAVDWWAFGILIYEMLLGQAPFRGDDEDEIFDAILEDEPLYPIHMPPDSVSILHKLLTRDPSKRLGAGPTDAEEVKAHPFFRDINWDDMFNKRVAPPFRPTLKNPSDTSWFDTEFTSEKPTLTPIHSVLSAQDQAEFKSFSWTAPHVM
jgi:classical protein kinase C